MMENTVKIASLISYITAAASRPLDPPEISAILKMIGDLRADYIVINRMLSAIQGERKIEAIKEYRTLTGSSLLDAKNAIEGAWPHPLGRTSSETEAA